MTRVRCAARWSPFAALALGVFEACTSGSGSTPLAPPGPPSIAIGGVDALACDDSLVVHLALTNWVLKPPYNCGTQPQCGSVLVTLLDGDGKPLVPPVFARAATADVQLDLTDLVTPNRADGSSLGQVHLIQAELYGDSLQPFPVSEGAITSVQQDLSLALPADCAGRAGAGSGGASGIAGAATAEAGASSTPTGAGGEGGASGTTGTAGSSAGGSSSSAGSGGSSETGAAGEVATAGVAPI